MKPYNEREPEPARGSLEKDRGQQTSEVVVQESAEHERSQDKQTTQTTVEGSVERDEVSKTQNHERPTASPAVRPSRQHNLPGHLKDFKLY